MEREFDIHLWIYMIIKMDSVPKAAFNLQLSDSQNGTVCQQYAATLLRYLSTFLGA